MKKYVLWFCFFISGLSLYSQELKFDSTTRYDKENPNGITSNIDETGIIKFYKDSIVIIKNGDENPTRLKTVEAIYGNTNAFFKCEIKEKKVILCSVFHDMIKKKVTLEFNEAQKLGLKIIYHLKKY